MYADHLLRPWFTCLIDELPGCRVFDAHTHVGDKDPSGFSSTWEELLAAVEAVDGRAAVFPMSETDGYRAVNLACADAASRSGGRLTAFARDGQDPLDLGPPPTAEPQKPGTFLEIVSTNLVAALEAMQRGLEPETPLRVARHGCAVGGDDPDAPVLASVLELLDLYERHHPTLPPRNQFRPGWDLVAAAAVVARTPAAPLP